MQFFRRGMEWAVAEIEDPMEQRRAELLSGICIVILGGAPLFMISDLFMWNVPGLLAASTISAISALCLYLVRRQHHHVASWVLVLALSVVSNTATLFAGGILAGSFPVNAIAVVLGGVLLRSRGVALTVLLAAGFGLGSFVVPMRYEMPLGFHVTFWSLTLSVLGVLVVGVVSTAETALERYFEKSEELGSTVAELQSTTLSKEYLTGLLGAMQELIVVTDAEHVIVSVAGGGAHWSGWSVDDLVGTHLDTLFSGIDLARPRLSRDVTLRRADGTMVSVVVSQGSMPEGFVWAASDASALTATTTALRQAHESARAANAAKTSFLANMSHELRTPLNAIIGYSELLEDEIMDDAQLLDLSRIGNAAHSLLELINGVLDLSKVESGKVSMSQDDVLVTQIVDPVVAMMQPVVDARGLTLEVVGEGIDGPTIFTDEQKLRAVLQNLLSNAIKFTDEGTVWLRVERWERSRLPWIRFVVEDTGIGMTQDDLEVVFEPFTRRDQENERQGTGLGLSICKAYIEMMGGQIHAGSAPGQGSTFVVELPAARFARQHRTPTIPLPDGVEQLKRILVIDDDPAFLEFAGRVLANDQRQIVCTSDPLQGLGWANRFQAHLILLDIDMPTLSGWAFLVRLRATRSAETPVLVISGQAEQEVAEALGCAGFMMKPVGQQQLSAAVDGIPSAPSA